MPPSDTTLALAMLRAGAGDRIERTSAQGVAWAIIRRMADVLEDRHPAATDRDRAEMASAVTSVLTDYGFPLVGLTSILHGIADGTTANPADPLEGF